MATSDNRSERDLLIKLETKFESMNDNVNKIDKKLDDFNARLEHVVKEIKDDLKNDYVTKQELAVWVDALKAAQDDLKQNYTPLVRFEPVEIVHKDVAKRLRTMLISVGVCVLIAAASAPTWISIYRTVTTVTTVTPAVTLTQQPPTVGVVQGSR